MSKPKIAMIGAGSLIFCKTLVMDILATEALGGSEICLMNRTRPKLAKMEAFVKKVIRENRLPAKVTATLNRREALDGADYVINMIQIGGVEAFRMDYEIPLKYGVDQCIADSIGPGGIFRALRTIPVLADMAADMNELCPDAILLNYANPMGANCSALGCVADVQFIGLCHGVQTTLDLISRYVNVPKEQVDYVCAGINHMAWFLSLRDKRDGRDLYPILKRNIEKPEYYVNEKVRCEVMRHFGYFMTESTGHLSEYVPWFRKTQAALARYCDEPAFGGETGAYYHWSKAIAEKYAAVDPLKFESTAIRSRSVEYCSYIMEAVVTGRPFRFMGNVRNDGYISNLPPGCCVEVPTFADNTGLHPSFVGELPPQCAAACQTNVNVQTLAALAALEGEPEAVVHAVALDPLASAVCTLDQIRTMCAEMLEAQRQWLPQFAGKTIAPKPAIVIPRGCRPVEVPLDPALAIGKRFGTLMERKA